MDTAAYWSHPYYQTTEYKQRLEAAQKQEKARQALMQGKITRETIAYAKYLNAVEQNATLSHGRFKPFAPDLNQLEREFPDIASAIRKGRE